MPKRDFSEVNCSARLVSWKRPTEKISSSIQRFSFEICMATIAKVRNVYFPEILPIVIFGLFRKYVKSTQN